MHRTLQIIDLILIGIIVICAALLAHFTDRTILMTIVITAGMAYVGIVSKLVTGDRQTWIDRVSMRIWNFCLSTTHRALFSFLALVTFVILVGWFTWTNAHVRIHVDVFVQGERVDSIREAVVIPDLASESIEIGNESFDITLPPTWSGDDISITVKGENFRTRQPVIVTAKRGQNVVINAIPIKRTYAGYVVSEGKPITEKVDVRVFAPNGREFAVETTNSRFSINVLDDGGPVYFAANSINYKTPNRIKIEPSEATNFVLPVLDRWNLRVHVMHSGDPSFPKEGHRVIAQKKPSDGMPAEMKTDNQGEAFFETTPKTFWQIAIVHEDKSYFSPTFVINPVPRLYTADLAKLEGLATSASTPDIARRMASVRFVSFPKSHIFSSNLSDVPNELERWDQPSWLPKAEHILVKQACIISYNPNLRIPNWVAYYLKTDENQQPEPDPRRKTFRPDPDLKPDDSASSSDYSGSGYDRGHLASSSDLSLISPNFSLESSYLSVICPQTSNLNRGVWLDIEKHGRAFSKQGVYVIAGSAFLGSKSEANQMELLTIGDGRVAVPTHFYRIMVRKVNERFLTETFLVPNDEKLDGDFSTYLTSIDRVEEVTGLDFFSNVGAAMFEPKYFEKDQPMSIWSE